MASYRLRAGALWTASKSTDTRLTAGEVLDEKADVCVIGKIGGFDTPHMHRSWIEQLRNFKGRITLDITDDHLSHPTVMSAFYADALQLAHHVVCSSRWLQAVVEQRFAGPVTVIEDAIDVPVIPPKSQVGAPLCLLWFGHSTNLPGLIGFLPLLPCDRPLTLNVVSSPQGLQMLHGWNRPSPLLRLQPRPWSPSEMQRAAHESDLCIIAVEQGSTRKAGVSSNRLLTALTLGLPTAADAVESYTDFAGYFAALRTPELHELMQAPTAWADRVRDFQREIPARFSMQAIGQAWLDCLTKAA